MFLQWKPIHQFLHFHRFPKFELDNRIDFHHLIMVVYRFLSKNGVTPFVTKIKTLYEKEGMIIELCELEGVLFVLKHKTLFEKYDKTIMIGILVMNQLQKYIPHFVYTYYETTVDNHVLTTMEYCNGLTLRKFFNQLFQSDNRRTWEIFLLLFYQVLFSLEIAQDNYFFTHYDLHLSNILLETPSFHNGHIQYEIGKYNYILKNPEYIVKIIDFEFTTVESKGKIIVNHMETIFPFGYMGIFFPGVDMLRFIMELRLAPKFNSPNGNRVNQFLDYIFFYFYKFPKSMDIQSQFQKHKKYFFNMTCTPHIYRCPIELIEFLEQDSLLLQDFLNSKLLFPFEKKKNHNMFPFFQDSSTMLENVHVENIPYFYDSLSRIKNFTKRIDVPNSQKNQRYTSSSHKKRIRILKSMEQILKKRKYFTLHPSNSVDIQQEY